MFWLFIFAIAQAFGHQQGNKPFFPFLQTSHYSLRSWIGLEGQKILVTLGYPWLPLVTLTRTPIRLCNILMIPTNCQFIGNLFSLVPSLNCVSDDKSPLRFPWKPSTPPLKNPPPTAIKMTGPLRGNHDLLRHKNWRGQDATFLNDKACLIRQLLY